MDKKSLKEEIGRKLSITIGLFFLFYILSARNGHIYARNIFIVYIVVVFIIIILPNRILGGKVNLFNKEEQKESESLPKEYPKERLRDFPKVIIFLVLSIVIIVFFAVKFFLTS